MKDKDKRLVVICLVIVILFITAAVFGQEYPKKMVIEKDTVFVLSLDNIRKINVAYSIIEKDSELIVLQNSKINSLNSVINSQSSIMSKYDKEVSILREINSDKDMIINKQEKKIQNKNKIMFIGSSVIAVLCLILIIK